MIAVGNDADIFPEMIEYGETVGTFSSPSITDYFSLASVAGGGAMASLKGKH